jgi:hypothetical protein
VQIRGFYDHEIDFDEIKASIHALSSTATTLKTMASGMTPTLTFSVKQNASNVIGIIVTAYDDAEIPNETEMPLI